MEEAQVGASAEGILGEFEAELDGAAGHAGESHRDVLEAVGVAAPVRHVLEICGVRVAWEVSGEESVRSSLDRFRKGFGVDGTEGPAGGSVGDPHEDSVVVEDAELGILFRVVADIKIQRHVLGGRRDYNYRREG